MTRLILALVAMALTSMPVVADTQAHEAQAREIYSRSIGFRTAEGQKQVPAMVAYLKGVLTEAGVPAADIATLDSGEAQAMLVRVPGRERGRPILFSAHMDVVDARPEDWERSPFTLLEENGVFYGRGTTDNKAGVAALMSTILRLHAAKLQPERDLVFGFVGDEETGMLTTKLIADHPWVANAEFAINTDAGGGLLDDSTGKPLIYLVQGAEKTYASFALTVTNEGGHSSRPRADNAIYQLARAMLKVEAYHFPVMANDLTRAYLGAVGQAQAGEVGEALRKFAADPADAAAAEKLSRSPEFVGTTRTTCVMTMLDAGHAENALPQKATATVNCRIFPGVPVEAVRDALVAAIADAGVQVTTLDTPEASPVSEMRPDVMQAITRAVHEKYPGVPIVPYLESGGTDGKVYRTAGIPTFASSGLFSKPSEMYAHGLNERLPVSSFYEGLDHIYQLAVELGGAKRAQ
ncbi:MAG: M20/M25/M40 family metallo-hydrolase [Steroidobacteraceae bacterium]|jgi:acetylornithine deacetylase/succinyl-diaminopimelate desuccinylase-like protein|nr:M20/M25/M40 family metallo-hydrolase [Steroidobacteraceae bacterium]MBP9130844.1 M20/M25/M40 family metallo-hydrolase [Steroidobacteraceae bacterium]